MSATAPKEETPEASKYQPKYKIESIDEVDEATKTQLEKSYTIWVMLKQDKNIEQQQYANVLKPVSSFKTVIVSLSPLSYQYLNIVRGFLGHILASEETNIDVVWNFPSYSKYIDFE